MKWFFVLLSQFILFTVAAQCVIQSEVQPNGTINKVTQQEVFYSTKTNMLYSASVYDGKNYYFDLIIKPITEKKIKKDKMLFQLANGTKGELKFYDTFESKTDTSLNVLFEIDKDMLDLLIKNDISSLTFSTEEGPKQYKLIKHHALLRKQLNCLMGTLEKK